MSSGERIVQVRLVRSAPAASWHSSSLFSPRSPSAAAFQRDEIRPGAKFTHEEYLALPRYCLAQNGIGNKLVVRVVPEEEVKYWYTRWARRSITFITSALRSCW